MTKKASSTENKIIPFEVFKRKQLERDKQNSSVFGKLVWLNCPTCGTMEFTSVLSPNGRAHKKCGNQVIEKEFDLDLRGEYTLCLMNIEILREIIATIKAGDMIGEINDLDEQMQDLEEHMEGMVEIEQIYIEKLKEASKGQELEPYVPGHPNLEALIEESSKDELGIMFSQFRQYRQTVRAKGGEL